MTSSSSMSGTTFISSRRALRTMGPMVAASLRVGSTAEMVRPCFSLSSTSRLRSLELGIVERGLAEPAIDLGRQAAQGLGGFLGRLEGVVLLGALDEGGAGGHVAGLDHDDRGRSLLGHVLHELAEEGRTRAVDGRGRGAHDHDLGISGFAQDGRGDVLTLDHPGNGDIAGVTLDEEAEVALGLGLDARIDAGRDHVQHFELGSEAALQSRGVGQRQLGMRAAADRSQDAADLADAALLDDRDVAGSLADDLVDGGAEDRLEVFLLGHAASSTVGTTPAEEDEVGLFLCGQLDDALVGATADAHDGAQLDAFGHELEHTLQQAPGLARTGGAVGELYALGHLHDRERGDGAALLEQRRPRCGRGPRPCAGWRGG